MHNAQTGAKGNLTALKKMLKGNKDSLKAQLDAAQECTKNSADSKIDAEKMPDKEVFQLEEGTGGRVEDMHVRTEKGIRTCNSQWCIGIQSESLEEGPHLQLCTNRGMPKGQTPCATN